MSFTDFQPADDVYMSTWLQYHFFDYISKVAAAKLHLKVLYEWNEIKRGVCWDSSKQLKKVLNILQ